MKEMFGPVLQYPPKCKKIHKARVDISDSVGLIAVIIEMVDFLSDIILKCISELIFIAISPKVEDVGSQIIKLFEYSESLHFLKVLVLDILDALVKESVVGYDELFDG